MEDQNPNQVQQPTAQPVPEQPAESKPKLTKWMIAGVAIVLIAVLGGGYILFQNSTPKTQPTQKTVAKPTPTPNPTANWKTFIYTYAGGSLYSIKYPSTWTALRNEKLVRFFPPSVKIINGLSPDDYTSSYISIDYSNSDPAACRGDCPPSSEVLIPGDLKDLDSTKYKVDEGQMATMCACQSERITVKNGDTYYQIAMFGKSNIEATRIPIDSQNQKNFDLMLSSFKFTDQISQTITTPTPTLILNPNLNTYKSTSYGFYFQYPKDFVFNNSSTSTFISLLQKQNDLMAQRLSVQVEKNNLSLEDFAKSQNYNILEGSRININGKEGLIFNSTFKIGQVCNNSDDTQITRTKALFVKGNGIILTYIPDDSCETLKTDWFTPIPNTIKFTQ